MQRRGCSDGTMQPAVLLLRHDGILHQHSERAGNSQVFCSERCAGFAVPKHLYAAKRRPSAR